MSETTALLLIHSPSGYDPLVGRVQEQLRKAQGEYEAALIRAPYARSAFLVVPASLTLTFIAAATFILLAVRPSGGSVVLSYLATALVPVLVQSVILVLFVAWWLQAQDTLVAVQAGKAHASASMEKLARLKRLVNTPATAAIVDSVACALPLVVAKPRLWTMPVASEALIARLYDAHRSNNSAFAAQGKEEQEQELALAVLDVLLYGP
jgi:hypothetical protein